MRTTYRKRLLSKILVILGTMFFSTILLNGSGAVPFLAVKAAAVTFNGCMTACQIFIFCLAMIISNGKVFKLAFSMNVIMFILALLNLLRDGFISCALHFRY